MPRGTSRGPPDKLTSGPSPAVLAPAAEASCPAAARGVRRPLRIVKERQGPPCRKRRRPYHPCPRPKATKTGPDVPSRLQRRGTRAGTSPSSVRPRAPRGGMPRCGEYPQHSKPRGRPPPAWKQNRACRKPPRRTDSEDGPLSMERGEMRAVPDYPYGAEVPEEQNGSTVEGRSCHWRSHVYEDGFVLSTQPTVAGRH